MRKFKNNGFTLLELLVVIGIIAVISVALVITLNPNEAMKKSRDSQRISDLAVLKKVIGIYMLNTSSPKMAGMDNVGCKGTTSNDNSYQTSTDHIYYSYPSDKGLISATNLDGVTFSAGGASQVVNNNISLVNGQGWLPIDFSTIGGGSPISKLPVDPVNSIADLSKPTLTDLVYRYVCSEKTLQYEIDAVFESEAFTLTDIKMSKDGGNNDSYYEVGTNLDLFNMESPLVPGTYTIVGQDHLQYGTVVGEDGKEWLDRNLGATRVATSYNDTQSYGDLYQWGRARDGHQIRTSGVTTGPSSSDMPGNTFIKLASVVSPWDWHTTQDVYWNGVSGTNNPCPTGFRLPTFPEIQSLVSAIPGFNNAACTATSICNTTAFSSSLKLPSSGWRDKANGNLTNVGANGLYWSSTVSPGNIYIYGLYYTPNSVTPVYDHYRANAFAVRCIKN